jgi:serine protease Do
MSTLWNELEQAATGVASTAGPATVTIGRSGRGSGVVVATGRVLTNAHNLRDRTTQVTFADGRVQQGTLVAADGDSDLAVLEVDTADVESLEWAEQVPGVGGAVFAVGRGGGDQRVTVGFVCGVDRSFRGPRGRRIDGGLEHTAPMARGASGGPLVGPDGRVVGINTHRGGDGFYLAQAADAALTQRVAALVDGHEPARVELGVAVAPAGVARKLRRSVGLDERDGVLVRGVVDGSPAAAADLREGDLIVGIGGEQLSSVDGLHAALGAHEASAPLELAVVRGVDELSLTVRFD